MAKGTVKWFNTQKGYGFIIPETGGRDVFVHITQLEQLGLKSLNEGQQISYELYADRDGRAAAGNLHIF